MFFDAYTSDTHYFHKNIILYCNRPYENIDVMNENLILNYNKKIGRSDTVLWLGDCFFTKNHNAIKDIMSNLKGKKVLLRGNHDDRISDLSLCELGFSMVINNNFLGKINDHIVRYSHYPAYELDGDQRYRDRRPELVENVTIIHGHTHEKNKINRLHHLHIGVDAWNYAPATYDEIITELANVKKLAQNVFLQK